MIIAQDVDYFITHYFNYVEIRF